ncbi:MAG: LPXTG cell wall anchor domain-containing protein, partial [Fastidiosipilaceae bacterium]
SFTAPAGKEFKAWDVGGVEKAVGDNITVDADTTVTALWKNSGTLEEDPTTPTTPTKPVTSTITVDPAGGTWSDNTTAAKTYVMNVGEKFTLPAAPTKTGFTFVEWQGSRYQPGDQYTVTDQDHTFTAVWKANPTTPTDQTTPPNLAALPKTGEQGSMVFWVGLMLLASGGLLLLARKKVNIKK